MAGFQLSINGRFWASTEEQQAQVIPDVYEWLRAELHGNLIPHCLDPDYKSFGPSPREIPVEGHTLSFLNGLRDEEIQAITGQYRIALERIVTQRRIEFALKA